MERELNASVMVKGEERYIVLFDDAHRSEALRTLGRWAANPELSFTWYDAAKMSGEMQANTKPESVRR